MVMEALCKNIRSELGLEGPECQIRNKTGLEIGFWVETSTAGQDAKRVLPEIFSFPVVWRFWVETSPPGQDARSVRPEIFSFPVVWRFWVETSTPGQDARNVRPRG
jgi:hypothetical protein